MPTIRGQKVVNMVVNMVSHICSLVELGPICNSMEASLCLKRCEEHSLLKSYNEGHLWKKIQVWSLKAVIVLCRESSVTKLAHSTLHV